MKLVFLIKRKYFVLCGSDLERFSEALSAQMVGIVRTRWLPAILGDQQTTAQDPWGDHVFGHGD